MFLKEEYQNQLDEIKEEYQNELSEIQTNQRE